ncbi:MAG: hypothetical protein FJY73_05985 [Candidatus Eisenbacteria bacterium]|nr:hypothetical protein [Candidatus Eisenbacteria bacterium]
MLRLSTIVTCVSLALLASSASGVLQDFEGPPAGTVVAGQAPGGGTAPGTLFAGITLGVVNNGGGPHSLIIFNSSAPTGGDSDLGTPNVDFGGPGIGAGGGAGMPGENRVPYGNLLIIAEDIVDVAPADGLVDDPDDEMGGGIITIDFHGPVLAERIVLVDIDEQESVAIRLFDGVNLVAEANALPLGDNSVQVISAPEPTRCTRVEIVTDGSLGIGEIEYREVTTATEHRSWGDLKKSFR